MDVDALDGLAIEFADRAVFLARERTLVLADVHLGRDETSNVQASLGEREDVVRRFESLVARFEPETVVVAGDLLHSFSTLPHGVTETLQELRTTAARAGARTVVLRGNHDTMLEGVWDGPVETAHRVGEWAVCHGHEPPSLEAERYLVGHDHPTITIEGQRRPCYLYGEDVYRGSDVLMLPAFTRLAAGVEVNGMSGAEFLSPLVREADPFRPIVVDESADEPLAFPPLGEFRRML